MDPVKMDEIQPLAVTYTETDCVAGFFPFSRTVEIKGECSQLFLIEAIMAEGKKTSEEAKEIALTAIFFSPEEWDIAEFF